VRDLRQPWLFGAAFTCPPEGLPGSSDATVRPIDASPSARLIQTKLEPLRVSPIRLKRRPSNAPAPDTKSHSSLDMRNNPAIAVAVITICLLLLWLMVLSDSAINGILAHQLRIAGRSNLAALE